MHLISKHAHFIYRIAQWISNCAVREIKCASFEIRFIFCSQVVSFMALETMRYSVLQCVSLKKVKVAHTGLLNVGLRS